MNKTELIEALRDSTDLSKVKAAEVINEIFDAKTGIIAKVLSDEDSLTIPGFGTFSRRHRKERQGVNPATKQKITIAAKDYPAFKAGKTLKDQVS